MKIFSLQSKTGLAVWSVVVGLVLSILISISTQAYTESAFQTVCASSYAHGWPAVVRVSVCQGNNYFSFNNTNEWINLFFWILVVLIILSLIRYFKKKHA